MLVLTRKNGQRLMIGENVVVTVLSVRNGQVRLGIEAPRSVSVQREELTLVPVRMGNNPELAGTATR